MAALDICCIFFLSFCWIYTLLNTLSISFKDEDGELVTFSSGEELVEALGSIDGEVFRIYVKVVGESASDGNFEGKDLATCKIEMHHIAFKTKENLFYFGILLG